MQKTADDDDSSMAVFFSFQTFCVVLLANIYCTSTCVGHWDKRNRRLSPYL